MSEGTWQEAVEQAFADQRKALLRMLVGIVGSVSTAEDLVQDVYLRIAQAGAGGPVHTPKAFLYRTARNLAVDHLRRRRLEQRIFADAADPGTTSDVPSPLPSPESVTADRQRLARLDEALGALPTRARKVLILKRLYGWTYSEIAAHLGVSKATVEKDLRTAISHCLPASGDLETG